MNVKRILNLGLTIGVFMAMASLVSAQTINWQVHNVTGKSHWAAQCNQRLSKIMAKETDGRLKLNVYLGASSGIKGPDILDAVSDNLVQHATMWGSHVAGQEQIMEVFDLPLFIPWDYEFRLSVWKAVAPDFRKLLKERNNVHLWGITMAEPRMIYTKEVVKSLADLKGMKIRAMGPVETAFTRAIGAQAVPVNWSETYTALQQGMVDGNWVADLPHYDSKLHEVTKYIFDIGNAGAGNFHISSIAALNALPAALRDKLLSYQDDHMQCLWDGTLRGTTEGRKLLVKAGMIPNDVPQKDRAFMLSVAKPIIAEWEPRLDAESRRIYMKIKKMVDAYNAKQM